MVIAGFMQGTTILKRIPGSEHPSILALSIISSGMESFMNCIMKKALKGFAIQTQITDQSVLVKWANRISIIYPIIEICVGSIMPVSTSIKKNFFALNSNLAKAYPIVMLVKRQAATDTTDTKILLP